MAQRRLCDPERRIDVGFKGRVKIFRGQFFQRLTILLAACVIHQDVQPAQFSDGLFHQVLTKSFVPHIARKRDGIPSFRFNQGDHFRSVFFLFRQIVNGDICPFAGIGNGYRASDAGIAPGN